MVRNFIRGLGIGAALIVAATAGAQSHKLRVNDPALAKSLLEGGGKLVADYGSFQIMETDVAVLTNAASDQAEMEDRDNIIELNARPLDTRTPEMRALRNAAATFTGKRLHLVHFAGPISPEWLDALERSGAQIISYVPQNAYLIYGDAPALARMQGWVRAASYVQWEGDYADDYKIHPRARLVDEKGDPQIPPTDVFAIQLVDDTNANPATLQLIDQLKREPIQNESHVLNYLNVIVRISPGDLPKIATRPEVISIQPYFQRHKLDERQDQIVAGNLIGNAPTGPGYLAWLASKGFSQAQFDSSGFLVDVSDSGIDNGTTTPGHFALYDFGIPTQPSRVAYNRLEGAPNRNSTLAGCDGHGNLNAHIIAGYSAMPPGFKHTDAMGFEYGLGVCPFVRVGSSVIFDPDIFTNPKFANLQADAYHSGARISANSWGSDVSGAYDTDAQTFDALVRDAQPAGSTYPTTGNQGMVIVFAAGNAGPGTQTMDSPGSAKNVITVGASENVRSLSPANGGSDSSGNDGCNTPDTDADNADDVSDFSGRGPCADGRMKPDIVAPGTHITGGVAQAGAATTNGTGIALSCFSGSGVCGLLGNNFFPLSQQFYTVSSGTSHSTPAVAGACALLRQYFINSGLAAPSPAMTKACLMDSARYLNGIYGGDTLWSSSQGMGTLNLGDAFDGVPRVLHDQITAEKFTATGQTRTLTGIITDSSKPFRVTLAWTDAPGSTTGSAYNNNLDLTVTVGGNTYKGNVFSGAYSVTGGNADFKNNVESVLLPAGVSGSFVVTVTAANIVSDAVPNEAPSLDQDFALVIYNAVEAPVPVIALDGFTVTSENCFPTNGVVDPGETVTLNFALRNTGGADTTNLTVTLMETNGVTSPSAPQSYGTLVAGGGPMIRSFTFTAAGLCGGTINPVLQLNDGSEVLGRLVCSVPLGLQLVSVRSATNSARISIPASGTLGKASPYPTTISISGITGTVSKVTVTLAGLTHTYPDDIDAVLVGPAGQSVMLMSDAGGANDVSGVNLTFDDDTANPLPDSSQIFSGMYKPTNYDPASDNFPAPAPTGPFGQTLSAFRGLDPNGTWSLYIQDDASGDAGALNQGWSINIITSNAVCCAGVASLADLAAGQTVNPGMANIGAQITFTFGLTNLGPDTATGVIFTDALPAGLSFVSANSSQGAYSNNGAAVTCALGTLTNGAAATVTITAVASASGTWTNSATVSSSTLETAANNNTATAAVSVNAAPSISTFSAVTIPEDTPVGPIPFTIGDPDTLVSDLMIYADSSDPNLVWAPNILWGGSGTNRTLTVWPSTNQNGSCTMTVSVTDGMATASNSFLLTVTPVNDPPVLAPEPDRTIHVGSMLMVGMVATDPEQSTETLTFTLGTNAPSGALIDSMSGMFSWTPNSSFVSTTNVITVRVNDNGIPPQSDQTSFAVIVVPPPMIQSISLSNNVVTINWSAISGQTYRVQYTDDLVSGVWTDLQPDVYAIGPVASKSDTITSSTQRLYRILVP